MRQDQKPTAADKLREAARLVREVAAMQNVAATVCPTCGLSKAHDLEQARASEHLSEAAKKLDNWSKTLGGKRLHRSPTNRPRPKWVPREEADNRGNT